MSSLDKKKRFAAIELGGTKVNCLVSNADLEVIAEQQFPTTTPHSSLSACGKFFEEFLPLESLGIGAFGPINVDPQDENYGRIEPSPKVEWSDVSLVEFFSEQLDCDIVVDTDVNAAALAEAKLGNGKGLKSFIYLTVGTGIGGGAVLNSQVLHGLSHPEMGHIKVERHHTDTEFTSCCPFHDSCAEGLASGLAVSKRWGKKLEDMPDDHPAWSLQAYYLGQLLHTLVHAYSPQRIIVGGGASNEKILKLARLELHKQLNGYVNQLREPETLEQYICLPSLGSRAGPLGALLLTQK